MPKVLTVLICLSFLLTGLTCLKAEEEDYLIGAGDVIQIFVWEESNLNISVPVRPDGKITVPLAGEIIAEKQTTIKLTKEIKTRLENFIKTPTVTVIVTQMNSNVVYVIGGVSQSGAILLKQKTTLLQLISLIGGFTEYAKLKKAHIIRDNQKIELNLKKLLKKSDLTYNIVVKKGDVLVVPE